MFDAAQGGDCKVCRHSGGEGSPLAKSVAETCREQSGYQVKSKQRLMNNIETSLIYSYGTIPYLGTFLTDLTMIDTAIPDTVTDGLINFDKRRKEFEVLAQVRLLY